MKEHWSTHPVRRHAQQRGGFALLDAILGGVLLGIGLTVVLTIGSRSLNNQTEGEMRLTASWLADETLSMILVEGPDRYPRLYDLSGAFDEPFEYFQYDINIDMKESTLPAHVAVLVTWPGARAPVLIEADVAPRQGDLFQPREPIEPIERQQRWDDYYDALEEGT